MNFDALEEVQIITDGFSPEYGQALGGTVNTVTKSGSNDFGGEVAWGFRSDATTAEFKPTFIATPDEYERSSPYVNVGGPILKDKLFYFAAYNPVITETDFTLTSGGTTNPVTGDAVEYDLDGDGVAEAEFGPGQTISGGRVPKTVTRERSIDNYAGKVSWFATPNHKIELTAFGDPSEGDVGPQNPTATASWPSYG